MAAACSSPDVSSVPDFSICQQHVPDGVAQDPSVMK